VPGPPGRLWFAEGTEVAYRVISEAAERLLKDELCRISGRLGTAGLVCDQQARSEVWVSTSERYCN
jgi:hypothetical protein